MFSQHPGADELGHQAPQIGTALSAASSTTFAAQLLLMPRLLRSPARHVRLYNACMALWLAAFAVMPALPPLARAAAAAAARGADLGVGEGEVGEEGGNGKALRVMMWAGVACVLVVSRAAVLSYSCAPCLCLYRERC
jgi:hypothetical protein